jgi:hypothetical protein
VFLALLVERQYADPAIRAINKGVIPFLTVAN